MTLTFDVYVIFFGQGKRFHPKLSEVSMINNKKVGSDFIEIQILSGAITDRRGARILSVLVD